MAAPPQTRSGDHLLQLGLLVQSLTRRRTTGIREVAGVPGASNLFEAAVCGLWHSETSRTSSLHHAGGGGMGKSWHRKHESMRARERLVWVGMAVGGAALAPLSGRGRASPRAY
jgi:hypothetical protein